MPESSMPESSMPFVIPFVSICTPTFNRRPFILNLIKCVDSQTYPKDKMEWIIVDDGTDKSPARFIFQI
jgi:glycosyltransferase involved in cell wall biosynthesis